MLATLTVVMVVNQTGVVIISPLVVEIAAAFQVPVGLAGQLRAASALVSGLAAPWLGTLSDRAGRKPVILSGLTVIGLSALASALAPGFGWLLTARALGGLGIAALLCGYGLIHGVRGATSSALGLRLGEAYRGTMMALRASVVQLGYVFGGLFGGMLLERWGFPALAIAYAAFLVAGGIST